MTKDEHYKKAKELIKKQPDKGIGYIRGSLNVKGTGELSDRLRELLDGEQKKKQKAAGKKKSSRSKKT